MSEKKVVSRNITIALGIICIIVLVGLVGAVANYTSIINNKDKSYQDYVSTHSHTNSEFNSLNTSYHDYMGTHSHTNSEYDDYVANHHHTDSEYNDLTDIVNLAKSTIWVNDQTISQPASSYTYWTVSANYAGYVSVQVHTSTTDNTYVRVIYSSHGVNYDHQITVGVSGTAVFPLLPSSSIEIRVGNSNWFSGATETVTITYYY